VAYGDANDPQDTSLGARLRGTRDRLRAQRKDSSPPAPGGGRDPLVHRDTEKARFFRGDWRNTWPHDFEVGKGETHE
jgi:hypothetical protein